MAEASIRARIAADASGFQEALKSTEDAARAWGIRMAAINVKATSLPPGMAGGAGGARGGMAILELSRGIEDLQYGIRGVLNNIPSLIQQLGGSAGLAGAMSLAAVAAFQLGTKLKAMWDAQKVAAEEAAEINEKVAEQLDAIFEKDLKAAQSGTADGAERLKESTEQANKALEQQRGLLAKNAEGMEKEIRLLQERKQAADDFVSAEAKAHAIANQELATTRTRAAIIKEAATAADLRNAQREARDVNESTNARIVELQKRLPETRKKEAKEAEEASDKAFIKEMERANILQRNQEEVDAVEKKQLDRLEQLQKAYDKEAEALGKINREHKEALGHIEKEARIKGLRETGRDTQADREERALRTSDRMKQIIQDTGVSPARAATLATQLEGGGRISARSRRQRQAGGIDQITEAPRESDRDLRRLERILSKIEDNTSGQGKNKSAPVPRQD